VVDLFHYQLKSIEHSDTAVLRLQGLTEQTLELLQQKVDRVDKAKRHKRGVEQITKSISVRNLPNGHAVRPEPIESMPSHRVMDQSAKDGRRTLLRQGLGARLRNREILFGVIVEIPDPAIVEILGLAGFDFALIDCEHGAIDVTTVASLVRACHSTSIGAIVRPAGSSPVETLRLLDCGVAGIHVPHVRTRLQAEKLVQSTRYYPEGSRGLNPFVRAAGFSAQPVQDYIRAANEETLLTISVEGKKGVANLDGILSTRGVDVVFLGPYDLSESLGLPGEVSHPSVTALLERLVGKIREAGKVPGIFCDSVPAAKSWIDRGVQYVVFSVDAKIYLNACTQAIRSLRSSST